MGEVLIDSAEVRFKLDRLFSVWKSQYDSPASPWHGVDVALVLTGKNSSEDVDDSSKLVFFQLWLTGFLFPETLMVFTRDEKAFILSSTKKISHLEQIRGSHEGLELLVRSSDESNAQNVKRICDHVKTVAAGKAPVVCRPKAPPQKGNVAELWESLLDFQDVRSSDSLFSVVMAVRSDAEMKYQKMSAQCCAAMLRSVLVNRIEQILDNDLQASHSDIASRAEVALDDKKLLNKWKEKYDIDPSELEVVYSNVQSGHNFVLDGPAEADAVSLSQEEGTIVVSVATKYSQIPSHITRTLLLNGKKEQKDQYSFALEVLNHVVATGLQPGKKFSEVYSAALSFIREHRPNVVGNLTKSVGHCMSTEFKDSALLLEPDNTASVVEAGMVFNLSIGLEGLKTEDDKGFAIWLADTVAVAASGEAEVMTDNFSKDIENMSYELEDDEPEPGPSQNKQKKEKVPSAAPAAVSAAILNNADTVIMKERLRRRDKATNDMEVEERDRRQRELREKKLQEIRNRFQSGQEGVNEKDRKTARKLSSIRCFEKFTMFPPDARLNKLYVDNRSESLLVPINGTHIPFHVMTLKNVQCNAEEGQKHHSMRINFQVPGSQTLTSKGEDNPLPDLQSPNALFIKELLFRSEDGRHLQAVHRSIKELIKRVKQKETEADVARDLADQATLQINRSSRRVMLKDLLVRPNMHGSKKIMGSLEAHTNGFRFQVNNRGGHSDHVDITYANIKHAVFQPCERELIVLIHFHLKSPIMVGKKKTQDVQFYCEAGAQTDDLDVRKKNYHDPDETQEELRDREIRRKLNNAFKGFVQQVEEMSGMEFDVPYRELMFYGVPLKSNAEILPTANCLVHLVEWPPFVLPLEDIEVVSFERVQHGLRNFDMVFIFQDYAKPVKQVTSIPTEYLDNLKRWLNELDIVWYENKNNLSWSLIMKTIREDVEGFVELGGFESVLGDGTVKLDPNDPQAEGDDDSDEDEEDEEYKGDGDDSGEAESDYSDESDESLASESDDESFQDMDSDEEEGLSWDELEERAKRDDRKRGYDQDDVGGNTRRKQKKR